MSTTRPQVLTRELLSAQRELETDPVAEPYAELLSLVAGDAERAVDVLRELVSLTVASISIAANAMGVGYEDALNELFRRVGYGRQAFSGRDVRPGSNWFG